MNAITGLTKQESVVLSLVAQGKRNAQIAQELYLSVRTVETHIHRIFQKLGLSTRTEAALYAFHSGMLSKPQYSEPTHETEVRHNISPAIR